MANEIVVQAYKIGADVDMVAEVFIYLFIISFIFIYSK